MTFLDGGRWDVASKITASVNINSGEVLKKPAGGTQQKKMANNTGEM